MPTFQTPEPISATIELVVSDVRISAGERPDTVVQVRPSDGARQADVKAAEQTRVEYSAGRLVVKSAGRWRSWSPFGYGGSVDVDVELPTGSQVTGTSSLGTFRCTGALGDCRVKTAGEIYVEQARTVRLMSAVGDIGVERASGDAELIAASGDVRAEAIDGAVVIKSSNGDIRVGAITGELNVKAANGDISIASSQASIVAKTANGDIVVGAAGSGSVVAETGFGAVEIAIPEGIAAWLDLYTGYGQLHNSLGVTEPPKPGDEAIEVRARTGYGDISIHRCNQPVSVRPNGGHGDTEEAR